MRSLPWLPVLLLVGCATAATKSPAEAPAPPASDAGVEPTTSWAALARRLPATPIRPVTDVYHGEAVTDSYRWLEDGEDPEVQAWMKRQDAVARVFLQAIPGRDRVEARVREILSEKAVRWSSPKAIGGRLFVLKNEPPKQQNFLLVAPSVDALDQAQVILDPNVLDPEGGTAIDWYEPSPDGTLVAISLSRSGTESGDVHFYEVATGQKMFDVIPRVQGGTAGGDVAWMADGKGVLYTRYPREGERAGEDVNFYQQIWFHRLGTPVEEDRYELGEDFPRIAETIFVSHLPTRRHLAIVQEGDSGRFQHYLRGADGRWRQLTTHADQITGAEFGPDGALYLLSLENAPKGRFLRLPPEGPRRRFQGRQGTVPALAEARLVVPEQDGAVQWDFYAANSFLPTQDRLYATYQMGGPTELRVFSLPTGRPLSGPTVPAVSAVGGLRGLQGRQVIYWQTSYTDPTAWYLYDPTTGETRITALRSESSVRFEDMVVERHFATSKDGTQVPFALMMRKGTALDGNNPVLATGYGGYGISSSPGFSGPARVWADRGGIMVDAGVRGGGEYGEPWHQRGSGVHKQNTFDDFAAVLTWLVEKGYTRPERIGILGGSNGGILMGAMITQHPGLQEAVVSMVGVYDMLRSETTPNGQFNVPEYGSVKVEEQFRALHAYSPYHRVQEGTAYPAVLFTAGANDPRVDPMHSRKFTAALQRASTSGEPILLRVDYGSGHGLDTALEERIQTTVDVYAFLMDALGMTEQTPRAP